MRYLSELTLGDDMAIATQILNVDAKRLHFFHTLRNRATGTLCATMEIMALHVDLGSRRAVEFAQGDRARIDAFAKAHAHLPLPDGAGRAVGQKR